MAAKWGKLERHYKKYWIGLKIKKKQTSKEI